MATVTRKFKANFECWSARVVEAGEWTAQEIEGLKELLRKDFTPGPDQVRDATKKIDDHEERYKLWDDYFAAECV